LLGLSAANQIVAVVFRSNPMATVVIQAVIVDLAVGRAGVRWEPLADEKAPGELQKTLRRIAIGAGAALAVTAIAIAVSVALGWAKLAAHAPNVSLVLGLLRAVAIGVRDSLLYVALPLHFAARARRVPRGAVLAFTALAAGAVLALHPAATPANVTLAVAVSALTAVFWMRDGAGWAAVGVAAGWAFFAGAVFRGALFDVDWKKGALAPGFVGDGAPAWIAAGLFAAATVALLVASGLHKRLRENV